MLEFKKVEKSIRFAIILGKKKLPMVRMSPRNSMYPLEVCAVPTTKLSGQMSPAITRQMITNTALLPADRKAEILNRIELLKSLDEDNILANWGIDVNTAMPLIEGKILPEPTIFYGDDLSVGNCFKPRSNCIGNVPTEQC